MNKKLLSGFVLILLIFAVFSGCTVLENAGEQDDSEKILGLWRAKDEEYFFRGFEFFEDGTCTIHTYELPGRYEIGNGTLIVTNLENQKTTTYNYIFYDSGKRLTLQTEENYEKIQYVKQ